MKPSTNLCDELWYELGWCNPSEERGDDHMKWWDGHIWWWSSARLGKEEREKQKWAQGKDIMIEPIFGLHSRHHRGCEWFMIDRRTIKRKNLWLNGLSSATRWHDFCICI
jgi:hypothetical protein